MYKILESSFFSGAGGGRQQFEQGHELVTTNSVPFRFTNDHIHHQFAFVMFGHFMSEGKNRIIVRKMQSIFLFTSYYGDRARNRNTKFGL